MTKHSKIRRTRKTRRQKGGDYEVPNASSQGWFSGISNWFSGATNKAKEVTNSAVNATESALGTGYNAVSSAANSTVNTITSIGNMEVPLSGQSSVEPQSQVSVQSSMGGKRRRNKRTMKGGKGDLGLTYYATPVSGLKVVDPTYWIGSTTNQNVVGGSRKRKTRRHKKH
jgi:hypothetical protein